MKTNSSTISEAYPSHFKFPASHHDDLRRERREFSCFKYNTNDINTNNLIFPPANKGMSVKESHVNLNKL